jgi:SAM-dependent methyltransferase
MKPEYVAPDYWENMYDDRNDERSVGYPNLARSINRARYIVERRNVMSALSRAGVRSVDRVLDIGSGTGIWIDFWQQRGARDIVGIDIATSAVAALRQRYPNCEFLHGDVSNPDLDLPRERDVVSAMSVLLHIVDDAAFERALRKLLACVRPGGVLVLVEPVIVHRWWGAPFGPESNSRARPLTAYTNVFSQLGFSLVQLRPDSCLLVNVIDTRRQSSFRLLERYWQHLIRLVGHRERLGRVVGLLLLMADLVATRIVSPGPSAKILVARFDRPPTA